jgi:[CysO sulfur-carrier protein]-S-L-cysteine hydrolase
VRISREQWDELVAHAREESPKECCGYLWANYGAVAEVKRGVNQRDSPYGYELDKDSMFALTDLDDEGYQVGTYHSHPRSAAEPSQTDINLAFYPDWLYLIVSLADDDAQIRAWRIADGRVEEEELVLDGG